MKKYVIIFICLLLTGCMKKEYTVVFDTSGGSQIPSQTVLKGEYVKQVDIPQKDGYIFVRWLLNGEEYNFNTPVKSNLNLKASWVTIPITEKYYNVIFNDGTKETKTTIKYKDKVSKPENPTLKYHNFIGWYLDENEYDFNKEVVRDIYLVAKFKKIVIPIKFNLNGGAGIASKEIEAGSILKEPKKPTKYGYEFLGWYIGEQKYNFNQIVTNELTLDAKWKLINYIEVKFNTNGGNIIESQILKEGDVVKIPTPPQKDGYIFEYWSYNKEKFNFDVKINENITLDAVYKKITE